MGRQLTWLSDAEWARIEPLLPHGRKGAHRVDDRRVISGIVHLFEALTGHSGIWGTVAIDATHIKAHRSAAGAKGGASSKLSAPRAVAARPNCTG